MSTCYNEFHNNSLTRTLMRTLNYVTVERVRYRLTTVRYTCLTVPHDRPLGRNINSQNRLNLKMNGASISRVDTKTARGSLHGLNDHVITLRSLKNPISSAN